MAHASKISHLSPTHGEGVGSRLRDFPPKPREGLDGAAASEMCHFVFLLFPSCFGERGMCRTRDNWQLKKALDIFPYRNILLFMPRATTSSDAFNAVAEPRRREILHYLATKERAVGDISMELGIEQPSVSKHLRVLHEVGLVRSRRCGRNMFYQTNAEGLRPVHEWTKTFERYWQHQLTRVKERAEGKSQDAR